MRDGNGSATAPLRRGVRRGNLAVGPVKSRNGSRSGFPCNDAGDPLSESHCVGRGTREWLIRQEMAPALPQCGIFMAGWSEAREGFCFVRPHFPLSQVMVCTDGVGEVWVDDRWQECGPGQAYATPSHVIHAYRALPGTVWTVYWVTYMTSFVESKVPLLLDTDPEPLSTSIRSLYSEAVGARDAVALQSWTRLVHTSAQRIVRPIAGDPRLHRLWEAVMTDASFAWDLPTLAQKADMSEEHLRRLCQRDLGCSPMEHVTRLRMQHALSLLISGHYTVAAAAESVGYSTPYAFSVAFKRVLDVPPSQYVAKKLTATQE